jgi:glutamate 5-kinase
MHGKTFQRIVVKIGSNVLAQDDGSPDLGCMERLVSELSWLHRQGIQLVLVSSGAVAFGKDVLHPLGELKESDAVSSRQLYAAVGQARLIDQYYALFRGHGIFCGQVLTTKENFDSPLHYHNQQHCIEVMLANGVIPVVNENDTVSVSELMFTDNDELSGLIALMLHADALFLLSNIDGIFDGPPTLPESKVIPEISGHSPELAFPPQSTSSFGRGGMHTKYRIARQVSAQGIEVCIANGRTEGILSKLATGSGSVLCTRFTATRL